MITSMGSPWTELRDNLLDKAQIKALDTFQKKGLTVNVKTNLGREVTIFDSSTIDLNGEPVTNKLVKYGVQVKDKNGKVIAEYGSYPKTNPVAIITMLMPLALAALYFANKR